MTRVFLFLCALWATTFPAYAKERPIIVFAAASLQQVLLDIAEGFDTPVNLSFGGSGTMVRQVMAGAPADAIILADREWMALLQANGLVAPDDIAIVACNRLVVVGPVGTPPLQSAAELPKRLGQDRLAMGHQDAVPAGRYAKEWMVHEGLWETLQNRLAEADSVSAARTLVARGQTGFGIVYVTDAEVDAELTTVWEIPSHTHRPIHYPAASLTPAGVDFIAYLSSEDARAIWRRHGFLEVPS